MDDLLVFPTAFQQFKQLLQQPLKNPKLSLFSLFGRITFEKSNVKKSKRLFTFLDFFTTCTVRKSKKSLQKVTDFWLFVDLHRSVLVVVQGKIFKYCQKTFPIQERIIKLRLCRFLRTVSVRSPNVKKTINTNKM